MQDQQSPHFLKTSQCFLSDSSIFRQYLPPREHNRERSISSEQSVLFTPQNYMLVLSYCSSMEKQVTQLRQEVKNLQSSLKEMTTKNNQAQHIIQSLKGEVKSTRYSFNVGNGGLIVEPFINSFQMAYKNSGQQMKNVREQIKCTNNLPQKFEKNIIQILKNENKLLAIKIQELYKQNQRLIVSTTDNKCKKKNIHMNQEVEMQNASPFLKINIMNDKQNKQKRSNYQSNPIIFQRSHRNSHFHPQQLNRKLHILHKDIENHNYMNNNLLKNAQIKKCQTISHLQTER